MTKLELEVKLEALQKLLGEKVTEQTTYQKQIDELEKQLEDLNKPKLTSKQFDNLHKAIENAIGSFDFDDTGHYSIDFGIDYSGKVCAEAFSFDNASDLEYEIIQAVEDLFAEAKDDNQENQD